MVVMFTKVSLEAGDVVSDFGRLVTAIAIWSAASEVREEAAS
jgi:hypothetical protein